MSDTITPETTEAPTDYSIEIACHLENAVAIADLIETVCGTSLDGSDSRIDELANNTLRSAISCIRQELCAIDDLLTRDYEGVAK
jgi:hypothetical protein